MAVSPDFSSVRASGMFSLDPDIRYLNHGAFGVVPIPVQQAQQRFRTEMEANPQAFFTRGLPDRIATARHAVADFLGAEPDALALVPNATAAVQLVLNSLRLRAGEEIVITDHGYGAVALSVARMCRRVGATVREARLPLHRAGPPADDQVDIPEEIARSVAAAVQPGRTRLVILDQITSPTAKLLPVRHVAEALRPYGVPLLVDAAHAPGMLPVDLNSTPADYWVGNLHKWAFAPRPTAVLWAKAQHRLGIEPLVTSWEDARGFPGAIEFGGTLDYTSWLAAPHALAFLDQLGPTLVRQHNAELAAYGQQVVARALGLADGDLPAPPTDGAPVAMRLIPLPEGVAGTPDDAVDLRDRIAAELGCEVAVTPWNGRGYLRIAAQVYNQPEDYEILATGLPRLLSGFPSAPAPTV